MLGWVRICSGSRHCSFLNQNCCGHWPHSWGRSEVSGHSKGSLNSTVFYSLDLGPWSLVYLQPAGSLLEQRNATMCQNRDGSVKQRKHSQWSSIYILFAWLCEEEHSLTFRREPISSPLPKLWSSHQSPNFVPCNHGFWCYRLQEGIGCCRKLE